MFKKFRLLSLVLLAILCGLVAGILGEIITRVYIFKDFSVPYLSRDLNVADLNANRSNVVISNPQKVVVNADVKITETLNSLRPSLVGVFKSLPATAGTSTAPEYYALNQPLFIGLVITTDGWVAATVPENVKRDFNLKNYLVITSDRKVYTIDKIDSSKNLLGDLLLFHLAGANNLNIVKMSTRADLTPGKSLLLLNNLTAAWPATLVSVKKTAPILSSDTVSRQLLLSLAGTSYKNYLVFDLAGNLSAVIGSDGAIIPAFSYNAYWLSLVNKTPLGRPWLGINYLDLSVAQPVGVSVSAGALLYSSASGAAVLKNSPAQLAGLQAGDIITWVDNQELNADNDLADLITNHQAGDTVTLSYRRGGQNLSVDVKLGELK